MTIAREDARIRALRPPKPTVDPRTPHGVTIDDERRADGSVERALTVFLAGAECPFTCAFCDLWRFTIDGPTAPGAIPAQIREALATAETPLPRRLKLYNASNFFDARAVPTDDWPAMASLTGAFGAVTVESHASMVTSGTRVLELRDMLRGSLEVAMGLETSDPVTLGRLNKRLDVRAFDRAAAFLRENDIELRVFVLLGIPFVAHGDRVASAVAAVRHAIGCGAAIVSVIPVRGGNGEMERLQASGEFVPPTLAELEDVLDACLSMEGSAVAADLWDFARLTRCRACGSARAERLRRINVSGRPEPRVECAACGGR